MGEERAAGELGGNGIVTSGDGRPLDGKIAAVASIAKSKELRLGIALFASYLFLACIVFYPVVSDMMNVAPGSGGTAYQNLWDVWWVGYALLHLHSSFYFTNLLYYPLGVNLVYHDIAPLVGILSLPFQAVSVPFAYNMLLLVGFALSGVTMFILSDYIVRDRRAAFVAGLVFAFSSFHIAQGYADLGWINIEWVPLALYFLLRMIRGETNYGIAFGLGASVVLAVFMGSVEQGAELFIAAALVLCAYLIGTGTRKSVLDRRLWAFVGISVAIAFVLGSWGFMPMIDAALQPSGIAQNLVFSNATYSNAWSDGLLSFFVPSFYNGLFDWNPATYFTSVSPSGAISSLFLPYPSERVAYIGYMVLALALYGLYINYRRSRLWIGLAVIFGLLCLGPAGLLYSVYHSIFAINIISQPDRFYLVFSIAVAIMAAFGFKDLLTKLRSRADGARAVTLATAIVIAVFIIENNGIALSSSLSSQVVTNATIPQFYKFIGSNSTYAQLNFSILELPVMQDRYYSVEPALFTGQAAYYATAAHRPILGGYVGPFNTSQKLTLCNVPIIEAATYLEQGDQRQLSLCTQGSNGSTYTVAEDGLEFSPKPTVQNTANESLLLLDDYNTAFVVVNRDAYNQTSLYELVNYLVNVFGRWIYIDNSTIVFSTLNATARNAYRGYVTYPVLTQWTAVEDLVNGTEQYFWTPFKNASALYGQIAVLAPYANLSDINYKVLSTTTYYINSSITVDAGTNFGNASLIVDSAGANGNPIQLADIAVTPNFTTRSFNAMLVSGPIGNTLFFVQRVSPPAGGAQQLIFIKDISITRQ